MRSSDFQLSLLPWRGSRILLQSTRSERKGDTRSESTVHQTQEEELKKLQLKKETLQNHVKAVNEIEPADKACKQ